MNQLNFAAKSATAPRLCCRQSCCCCCCCCCFGADNFQSSARVRALAAGAVGSPHSCSCAGDPGHSGWHTSLSHRRPEHWPLLAQRESAEPPRVMSRGGSRVGRRASGRWTEEPARRNEKRALFWPASFDFGGPCSPPEAAGGSSGRARSLSDRLPAKPHHQTGSSLRCDRAEPTSTTTAELMSKEIRHGWWRDCPAMAPFFKGDATVAVMFCCARGILIGPLAPARRRCHCSIR
jgi:hypothetical protein